MDYKWRSLPLVISLPNDPRFESSYDRFGVVVGDGSANLIYPVNTILVCLPFGQIRRPPLDGEKLICYENIADEQSDERSCTVTVLPDPTVRQYVVDDAGQAWLSFQSSEPQFQKALPVTIEDLTEYAEDPSSLKGGYGADLRRAVTRDP